MSYSTRPRHYLATGHKGSTDVRSFQNESIRALQVVGDPFIYAILTGAGLIKIGITGDLVKRKIGIEGKTKQILAFRPGDLQDEQNIHASLKAYRAYDTTLRTEYYQPAPRVLEEVNWLRSYYALPPIHSV